MHLVVVDDEEAVRDSLSRTLRFEGYTVSLAADGAAGLEVIRAEKPDGVVLDLMMPVLDGLDSCRVLRAEGNYVPILMLTARTGVTDRVTGLDAGADDYLVKPFEAEELLARLRALGRRDLEGAECLPVGAAALDLQRHEVVLPRGERITLSGREFELLRTLAQRPKAIHPRASLRTNVFADSTGESIVDTYVYYLRRKLGRDVVRTVHGLGYQLGAV